MVELEAGREEGARYTETVEAHDLSRAADTNLEKNGDAIDLHPTSLIMAKASQLSSTIAGRLSPSCHYRDQAEQPT
jgi:hypothetical protein